MFNLNIDDEILKLLAELLADQKGVDIWILKTS